VPELRCNPSLRMKRFFSMDARVKPAHDDRLLRPTRWR
jgi:hypothetical protein